MVAIETFSTPATELPFPAVTVCRKRKYDVGEYLRAVYNNFEFACEKARHSASCQRTELLRSHFEPLVGTESLLPVTFDIMAINGVI